jgi:outer membrane protein assembly factor BamB
LTTVPNAAAIGRRYWSPGLNEGYVPQGLTVFGDEILIAAYRSTERDQDNGPARLFRLSRRDGRLLGSFALPATYGHPGGLATARDTLFVANSGRLLALDFKESCRSGECVPVKEVRVDKTMGPSFLTTSGDALWFGPYRREGAPNLHAVPIDRVLAGGETPIGLADSRAILPLSLLSQGATFDKAGKVWISQSSGNRPAFLSQLDPATGAVLARYPAPGGIEDLGFAPDGRLWAVGEAGTQRWSRWSTFYPLVFEIDPAKLVA